MSGANHSTNFLIPEGMDAFSVFFILIIIFSALYQLFYILSPQSLKKKFEYYDYDPTAAQ